MVNRFFDDSWQPISGVSSEHVPGENSQNPTSHIVDDCRELIDAISDGNSVVYLGAGASKAARLPDWHEFLLMLQNEVRFISPIAASSIGKRVRSGDYLVAAEMIQNELQNRLQDICHRTFGNASTSTPIHNAISSIPFSLAITTNYDCLLESAYSDSVPRLTWQNPHDILQNLRSRIFCVLKLHGDFAVRESIVLTRSHYRNLMQFNDPLLSCLKMLLATKTFLFCGVSFSDPDLLALLDEAKSLYGNAFGPHFAIVPKEFHDPTYASVLKKSYNIRTLVAPPTESERTISDPITDGVAELVSHIGARAAYRGRGKQYSSRIPMHDDEPALAFRSPSELMQIGWLLKDLVIRVGAAYGDVCLSAPGRPEYRILFRTYTYRRNDAASHSNYDFDVPLPHRSLQSRMFVQRKIENDFVVIPFLESAQECIEHQGYSSADYRPANPSTSASLLVPIYADGRRTGVITIEFDNGNPFSKYHLLLAKHFASHVGETRATSLATADLSLPLKAYGREYKNFKSILRKSRDIGDIGISSLLFQLNPFEGTLYAPIEDPERIRVHGKTWTYNLSEDSLACEAYKQRRTVREPRSERIKSGDNSKMDTRGRDVFKVAGPVAAFPVHVRGVTAGVFVGWSDCAMHHNKNGATYAKNINADQVMWRKNFWRAMERSRRIIHLIANEPTRIHNGTTQHRPALNFLEQISQELKPIDELTTWSDGVRDPVFRTSVINALLRTLVGDNCGLQRARFFVFRMQNGAGTENRRRVKSIVCVGSENRPKVQPPKKYSDYPIDYVGKEIEADEFVRQSHARAFFDPYARLQDTDSVGGEKDPSQSRLHKVEGFPWIVAPVGPQIFDLESGERRGMRPFGYIAADNFAWDPDFKAMKYRGLFKQYDEPNSQFVYQRFCIDLASDILAPLSLWEWAVYRSKSSHDDEDSSP